MLFYVVYLNFIQTFRDAVKTPEVEAQPAEPSPPLIAARQTSSAKPFLRRGSGLARYGGVKGSPEGVVRRIHSSGTYCLDVKIGKNTTFMACLNFYKSLHVYDVL